MLLHNDAFLSDLRSLAPQIDKFVADEAHVIDLWGKQFRKAFADLGTLRALADVPIMAASATLPKNIIDVVLSTLLYKKSSTFFVNLGNQRTNIRLNFRTMQASRQDPLADFQHIIDEARSGKLRRRFIFVNKVLDTMALCQALRKAVPAPMSRYIEAYNAQRGTTSKAVVMKRFESGEIKILFTTEAAGMVSSRTGIRRFGHYADRFLGL